MLINNICKNHATVKKLFMHAQEFSPWLLSDPRAMVTSDDGAPACPLL